MKRLFDHDPLTGITEWFHMEDGDDSFTIQTTQDAAPLIEANREHFNQFDSARTPFGDKIGASSKVASIPLNVYMDLKTKGILRDPAAFKRWLNDPDNRAFRTRPGTV